LGDIATEAKAMIHSDQRDWQAKRIAEEPCMGIEMVVPVSLALKRRRCGADASGKEKA